jgi:hypothetical protein
MTARRCAVSTGHVMSGQDRSGHVRSGQSSPGNRTFLSSASHHAKERREEGREFDGMTASQKKGTDKPAVLVR